MVSRLRHLMRKNPLAGTTLAALYLLGRCAWTGRAILLGGAAAGLAAVWAALCLFRAGPEARLHLTPAPLDYAVTDLGALPDGDGMSWAADINDIGQIVGSSHSEGNRKPHGFLWQNGRLSDLGSLAGGTSYAMQINENGLIVGTSSDADGNLRAVLWRGSGLTALDVGGMESMALGANAAGEVVGSLGFGHNFGQHAFLWRSGNSADLGAFVARSINTEGLIAGYEVDARSASAVLFVQGEIVPLLTLGGNFSLAYAINDTGQIAGMCSLESGEGVAVVWEGTCIRILGTLGGRNGWALGINNTGEVVGSADTAKNERHAFLWRNGGMRDLNSALPPDSGWVLRSASSINARGQIVGQGEKEGRTRAFLLSPR